MHDVVIVGAGASGLMAARELSKAGKKVVVLEARDRIGGRIYPLSEADFGYEAQGGAEFVHGSAPLTKALIQDAGLTLNNPTEWWSVRDGEPKKIESSSPKDPLLVAAFEKLTKDIPVAQFLALYFPGEENAFLREYVCRWVEGYDAADPARASTFAFRDEMTGENEWRQQNLKEGYGALLGYLRIECEKSSAEILLNKEVKTIDHGKGAITVLCDDGSEYHTRRIILTVPLPLLKVIQFIPALPEKTHAVDKIGFGAVTKILLRFKTKWWTGVREQIFERMFFLVSREHIPTWWTQYPEPRTVLTGWAPASKALALREKSDEEILDIALKSLSNIFKIGIEEIRAELLHYKIVQWMNDPYARGAYSYTTPESAVALEELGKPIDNKLFFAGEGVSPKNSTSTVEGALASGRAAARQILKMD